MGTHTAGGDSLEDDPEYARSHHPPAWSIAELIHLLDEAIDSAGSQLARSAGLWDDTPDALARKRPRSPRPHALGSSTRSAESYVDEQVIELELP
jgi:hypothetical protein